MAKPSIFTSQYLLLFFFFFLLHLSNQLEISQYKALVRIKQQLNFPQDDEPTDINWSDDQNQDLCNSEQLTPILTISCYQENITQLHISGNYNWHPNFGQDFTVSSLFSNIASFPNLKVLSLVSLGLKGPLPSNVGDLSSLEILNISSNSFNGSIPREISSLKNLQTLILDHNGFKGQVPVWLPGLTVLSMINNSFGGPIPDSMLSSMVSLRVLKLSSNNISGGLDGIDNLTNLQVADLEDNNLGPHFPILPKRLVSLTLKKNKFHSVLSDELFENSCFHLEKLDISMNEFVGQLPLSLFSLPSLAYLDVSGNKFTGKLAHNLSCNRQQQLKFVNFSENRLSGGLPDCLMKIDVLYDGNCFSYEDHHQHPLAYCHSEALAVGISPKEERRAYGKAVVVASSMVGGVGGAIAILGVAFVFLKREYARKQHNKVPHTTRLIVDKVSPAYTLQLLKDARYISETRKLGALGIPPYRTFVLDELKEATNNFNEINLIGQGSYGQVYKGWLTEGTIVGIRRLKMKKRYGTHTYTHQLELIAKLRHCHLVSAIGHCFECHQDDSSTVTTIFLVFEYVPNGTLRNFISDGHSGQKFTWTQRIAAGIGVAKGIQFLHTGIVPGVYSNNLKITDVLLDHDLHVKINKYNLPLFTENRILILDEVEAPSRGSKGKFGSMLSYEEKNDVYDFGVILLEMIVGRSIISSNDINVSKDILSVSLRADAMGRRSIVDPAIHKECSDDSLNTLIELCVRCLSNEPSERPSVEDVIWNLQFAAQVQETCHRDSPIQ